MKPRRRRSRTAVLWSCVKTQRVCGRTGAWLCCRSCLPVSCQHRRLHPSDDSSDVGGSRLQHCCLYLQWASQALTSTGCQQYGEGLKHQEREKTLTNTYQYQYLQDNGVKLSINLPYTCYQYQVGGFKHARLYICGEEDPSWPELVGHETKTPSISITRNMTCRKCLLGWWNDMKWFDV